MSVEQATSVPLRRRLDQVVMGWHRLINRACDRYRPERHYMRGPGPKWHAKYGAGNSAL
jgi:hypothetical protein